MWMPQWEPVVTPGGCCSPASLAGAYWVWTSILKPWNSESEPRVRPSCGRWGRLAVALPERWKLFGHELGGRDAYVGGVRVRLF